MKTQTDHEIAIEVERTEPDVERCILLIASVHGCSPEELDTREIGVMRDLAHSVWVARGELEAERALESDPENTPPRGIRARARAQSRTTLKPPTKP